MPKPCGYVVYCCENLRDGREEHAKVFSRKEQALEYINKLANGFFGVGMEFGLYELGKQVPIQSETIEEAQPPKTQVRFKLGKE